MFSSTSLDPAPAHRQSKPFPSISQPKLVGFFSIDAHRQYDGAATQLKYLSLPPPPRTDLHLNLNEGFEIHHPKPESAKAEGIEMLLSYLRHNSTPDCWTHGPESELSGDSRTARLRYDFVCFRGLLRLIACTPYERNTGWIVQAIRYRGTIYLCEKPTAEKLESQRNETEQQRRFCFYGFKFEQHILTDRPNIRPDTSEPVVLSEELCSLFDSTLAGKRLLYGAEMDGIVLEEQQQPPLDRDRLKVDELRQFEFVEVKVKRRETNQRQVDNFYRFKTKNWWCQSFLVNVQRIVVGLRDDRGIVREITEMKLKDLQRDSRRYWSAAVCINFLDEFLQEVTTVLKGVDDSTRVFQFEYSPRDHARVRYRDFGAGHPDSFLPQWYTQYVESK